MNFGLGTVTSERVKLFVSRFVSRFLPRERTGLAYCLNSLLLSTKLYSTRVFCFFFSQYRFDPHTGAWENKQFKKDRGDALFSLYDVNYDKFGMVLNQTRKCGDYKGNLDVSRVRLLTHSLASIQNSDGQKSLNHSRIFPSTQEEFSRKQLM